jgi:hypothetical protein
VVDYLYLFFVLRLDPVNYHLFRFDQKKRSEFKAYLDEPESPLLKNKLFDRLWPKNYLVTVHDKYIFHCLCKYHALPVPEVYGIYRKGKVEGGWPSLKSFMSEKEIGRIVLKPIRGLKGQDIHFVSLETCEDAEKELLLALAEEEFIIQEAITQHPRMDEVNPYSVNSIRVISILRPDGRVELLRSMLRMSSNRSPVDNFSTGGIVVGIDLDTGKLNREGFSKPPYGTLVKKHPVTGTVFEGFQIPYWEEIKDITGKAQKVFHHMASIGWDVAIGTKGPVIIEGNQAWGTSGIQAATGGLLTPKNRELFESMARV